MKAILFALVLLAPSCATRKPNVDPQYRITMYTRCMRTTIGVECLSSTDGLNWSPVKTLIFEPITPVQRVEVIR